MTRAVAATLAAAAGAGLVAGCATSGTDAPSPTPIVITETPNVVPVHLLIALHGQPTRSFIVHGGRWRVCDSGTVTDPGQVGAHDVRIVVTYLDHGQVVGQVGAADSAAAGGAVGDLAPGQAKDFTVCGTASNEPDTDRVSATVGTSGR